MTDGHDDDADSVHAANGAQTGSWSRDDYVKTAATIGVVAVGAALIEVSLIPGLIVGVAASFAPKYLPRLSNSMQPVIKSAVRGAYKFGRKTREAVAEAQEQVHDIVAEVRAEDGTEHEGGPHPHG